MIEFQCPGCLHFHVANAAFAGLRARCIVCGVALRVPSRGGVQAQLVDEPQAPLRRRGARPQLSPARSAAAPPGPVRSATSPEDGPAVELDVDFADDHAPGVLAFEESVTASAPGEAAKTSPRRAGPAARRDPRSEIGEDAADEIDLGRSEVNAPVEEAEALEKRKAKPAPPLPAIDPAVRRKRLMRLGAAGGLGLVIILCGVFFLSGGKQKSIAGAPRETSSVKDFESPAPPPPKPKPPEPKKVEPPKVTAEPILPPHLAGEAAPFAASLLVAERAAGPQLFDKNLEGRRIIVQGALARRVGNAIVLGDSADDARTAITCEMRKWELAEVKLNLADGFKLPLYFHELPSEVMTEFKPQPGQAVVVSGIYSKDLRLFDCEILRTTLPTDEAFKDRLVEVTGVVQQVQKDGGKDERFPTLFLTPPTTDPLISVRCLFRLSEIEKVGAVKVGQTVTVRGRCEGRLFRVVRFHDCALAEPSDPPPPGLVRVAADKFFAAYESDLLPVPRPAPGSPAVVTSADHLSEAFAGDPARANDAYRNKLVQVTGKVLSRGNSRVLLETGTGHRYQVELVFLPGKFALLREETNLTVRGVCAGARGGLIRIENSERYDPDLGNAAVRTTADYMPFVHDRELTYEMLNILKPKDNPIFLVGVRTFDPDLVRSSATRSGTFGGATLFGDAPPKLRWTKDLTKAKDAPGVTQQRRVRGDVIEFREIPRPPAQPADVWDPMFKIGVRKGESWSAELSEKRTVTYTVMEFRKDEAQRQVVEIRRIVKDPKDVNGGEESRVSYAQGIGEVRRVVMRRMTNGKLVAVMEVKLVDAPPPLPAEKEHAEAEKKDRKDGP